MVIPLRRLDYVVSVLIHAAVGLALLMVPAQVVRSPVSITFSELRVASPPQPTGPTPPRETAVEPVKPRAAPPARPGKRPSARAEPPPPRPVQEPPSEPQTVSPPEAVPAKDARADATAPLDFGLALTGGSGPGAGAVGAHGTAEPEVASKTVRRELTARPGLREGVEPQPCEPPLVKARALELPAPAYSEEARAASIEGKVRVELTVDSTGRVASARVLQGLGHGLDEAALAAAKEGRFEPARRCGEAVESTFVISIRFTL